MVRLVVVRLRLMLRTNRIRSMSISTCDHTYNNTSAHTCTCIVLPNIRHTAPLLGQLAPDSLKAKEQHGLSYERCREMGNPCKGPSSLIVSHLRRRCEYQMHAEEIKVGITFQVVNDRTATTRKLFCVSMNER